jgi:hypothetical protein
MTEVASHCPLTVEAQIRSQASLCGICGGKSGNKTGFSPCRYCSPFYDNINRSFMGSVAFDCKFTLPKYINTKLTGLQVGALRK